MPRTGLSTHRTDASNLVVGDRVVLRVTDTSPPLVGATGVRRVIGHITEVEFFELPTTYDRKRVRVTFDFDPSLEDAATLNSMEPWVYRYTDLVERVMSP